MCWLERALDKSSPRRRFKVSWHRGAAWGTRMFGLPRMTQWRLEVCIVCQPFSPHERKARSENQQLPGQDNARD